MPLADASQPQGTPAEEPPGAPSPEAGTGAGPPRRPVSPWRRILPKVLLAGGIALALTQLIPALPSDQGLLIDLPTGPGRVRGLDFTWTRVGDTAHAGGVRLAVPSTCSKTVEHTLRTPDGAYEMEFSLHWRLDGGTLSETSHHRRVNLSGGQTRIVLGPEQQ